MTVQKTPKQRPVKKGPISLPDEISPTVYLQQFVEWLQESPAGGQGKGVNVVHLRLAWLHALSTTEQGVVTYGEIGKVGTDEATLQLGLASNLKKVLKGAPTLYRSDRRYSQPTEGLSVGDYPFDLA